MMKMRIKRLIVLLLIAMLAIPLAMAHPVGDDDDKSPGIKQGIRRLHPERERLKAMKKLQEQRSRKAEPKDDPWDMTDEVWGTVDVPPVAARDSSAVEGHRIGTPLDRRYSAAGQASDDNSLAGYGLRRMTWQDLPVTASIDQLMPDFKVDEQGDYVSRYVYREGVRDEFYFTFNMAEDDSLPGPLRLGVRCFTDDLLDFDLLVFSIDGYDYPFYPNDYQQGFSDGRYYTLSDNELGKSYKDLVFALAHGHIVALKLMNVRGVQHVKMLTEGQCDDFALTLDLYLLLGGGF